MTQLPKDTKLDTALKNHHEFILKEWSSVHSKFLNEILSNEDVTSVLDIGANTGAVIEHILSKKTNITDVYAFEPVSFNYEMLKKMLDNEKYPGVNFKFHKYAIFYGASHSQMWGVGDNNPGGRFLTPVKEDRENSDSVKDSDKDEKYNSSLVHCTTLEKVMANVENIDLCKIDIEGSEWNVLENSSFIKNKVNIIILEIHNRTQEQAKEFLEKSLPMFEILYDFSHSGDNVIVLKRNNS